MINNRKNYLSKNDEYIEKLKIGLSILDSISKDLIFFEINISEKPWYKNTLDIYVKQAFEYYEKCKNVNFDYNDYNDLWIRRDFKSFLSEVEKFIKFIAKTTLKIDKNINFYNSINKLNIIVEKYKYIFNDSWINDINMIKYILDNWRKKYNENKHDEEKKWIIISL